MYRIVIFERKNPTEIYYGEEELILQKIENELDDTENEKRTVILLKSKEELEEYLDVVRALFEESGSIFKEIE